MRVVALLALSLLVLSALSGCTSKGGDKDAETDSTTGSSNGKSGSGSSSKSGTSGAGGNGTSVAVNRVPTANLTLAANATAGLNATFLVNGTDYDGDALVWSITFGDNGTANGTAPSPTGLLSADGTVLRTNATHAYVSAGAYNATLTVSDGKANATSVLRVEVAAGGVQLPTTVLHVVDATADATTPITELEWFEAKITGTGDDTALVMTLQVNTLWPTTAVLTPVSYSAIVDGHKFDSFARYPQDANPLTWDGAAYMASGTSSWDTTANQVTFTFKLSVLAEYDLAYPFQLGAKANFGSLLSNVEDDACPDSGSVPF